MIYDFLIELTIITSFLVLRGQVVRDDTFMLLTKWQKRLVLGITGGIMGCLLMMSSIQIANTTVVDMRYLAIVVIALYGGVTAVFTTAGVMSLFRILYFGYSFSSFAAVIGGIIMALGSVMINLLNLEELKRYLALGLFNFLVMFAGLALLLQDSSCLIEVLVSYFLMSCLGLLLIYFIYRYIERANKSYQHLRYYEKMANNLSDLLTRHDRDGTYLYVSPACETLLGYQPEELMGRNAFELFHPSDKKQIKEQYLKLLTNNQQYTLTYRLQTKNDDYKWVETTAKGVKNSQGEIEELICVTRDVTNRKEVETELKDANEKLTALSYVDGLTQIPNRRYFDEQLEKEWQRLSRNSKPLSLLIVDIDHFKEYNDTYGHQQGDECLKKVANTLKQVINRPADEVMRYGGEEFALVLPETDEQGALKVGKRVREEIEDLNIANVNSKVKPYITVSVGVATIIPNSVADKELLVEEADKALYQAKDRGRNQVISYS